MPLTVQLVSTLNAQGSATLMMVTSALLQGPPPPDGHNELSSQPRPRSGTLSPFCSVC